MKLDSNLSIFKVGVGPSSSHTLGPMVAGNLFCQDVEPILDKVARIKIYLHGSLALTGIGHLSDKAIIWGLNGLIAQNLTRQIQDDFINKALKEHKLLLCGKKEIPFNYEQDIIFIDKNLPHHENGLIIQALDEHGIIILIKEYYSIGGGFVKSKEDMEQKTQTGTDDSSKLDIVCDNATNSLAICEKNNWNLATLSFEYEKQFNDEKYIRDYCLNIYDVMQDCYKNGCNPVEEYLPGSLHLRRRAKGLAERVRATTDPMGIIDFISLYAIAISEENASGARVVTAPTNGACAVIPAVMLYLKNHTIGFNDDQAVNFILTAMLIGSFYKRNASISGAEAGCQAEIGAASSMAAAAMATVLGASAHIACNAAEVAMEHHLGLTCDPVGGLVQIPCIERNAFGAIKAISAARMSMTRKSTPRVSLDDVIKTMYQTGKDMNSKYRETSLGGLAINTTSYC